MVCVTIPNLLQDRPSITAQIMSTEAKGDIGVNISSLDTQKAKFVPKGNYYLVPLYNHPYHLFGYLPLFRKSIKERYFHKI